MSPSGITRTIWPRLLRLWPGFSHLNGPSEESYRNAPSVVRTSQGNRVYPEGRTVEIEFNQVTA